VKQDRSCNSINWPNSKNHQG